MKTVMTIAAVYLLAVGVAQQVSSGSTNSPVADQVAALPSINGGGGLFNIVAAVLLLLFAHSNKARNLLKG